MAQIAQQDNLYIQISGTLTNMEADTKQKLISCIQTGTITDVIVISVEAANKTNYGKVLGYEVDTTAANAPKYTIAVMDVNTGTAESIELN